MRRNSAWLVISIVVTLLAAGTPALAAGSDSEPEPESGCVVNQDERDLRGSSAPSASGYYQYEAWLASDGAQQAKDAIDAELEQQFGRDSKTDRTARLSAGLLGMAIDHRAQQIVVVVDAERVSPQPLEAALDNSAAAQHQINPAVGQLDVRVQGSCHSAAQLLQARQVIDARNWHPDAADTGYSVRLDPADSTYHLTMSRMRTAVGEALKARLGELVTIDYTDGKPVLDDRVDDSQPHWGGAGIGVDGDGYPNVCTSGFTVDTASAGKAMVTAGHCFRNGQRIESGNEFYGTTAREHDYPVYDMILINNPSQNYNDDIYHDPYRREHNPIDVDGGGNADVGDYLCISGFVSRAQCGMRVTDDNEDLCLPGQGCTYVLLESRNIGTVACQGGDSGGPNYRGTSHNRVYGIHIGRNDSSRRDICLAEQTGSIEAHLNVRVARRP